MDEKTNVKVQTAYEQGFQLGMDEALGYVMDIIEEYAEELVDTSGPKPVKISAVGTPVLLRELAKRCRKRLQK